MGAVLVLAQESVETAAGGAPLLWLVFLGALTVLGVMVWLLGRVLAKFAVGVTGFTLGGIAGFMVAELLASQGAMMIPLMIGGAIAGTLLAVLLFRAFVAVATAALLAAIVPAGVLLWSGGDVQTPPADTEAQAAPADRPDPVAAIKEDVGELTEGVAGAIKDATTEEPEGAEKAKQMVSEAGEAAKEQASEWLGEAREIASNQVQTIRDWWDTRDGSTRQVVYLGAGLGAIIGLLVGLILPKPAASFDAALAGSVLMVIPGLGLLRAAVPASAEWLPSSPRFTLLLVGLITIGGFIIHWMISHRRSDESS